MQELASKNSEVEREREREGGKRRKKILNRQNVTFHTTNSHEQALNSWLFGREK